MIRHTEYEIGSERAAFSNWLARESDAPDTDWDRAKRMLAKAIRDELTHKQRKYLTAYYVQELTMAEIAELYGVNKSTVSRTIHLAQDNLERILRHSCKRLQNANTKVRHSNKRKAKKECVA